MRDIGRSQYARVLPVSIAIRRFGALLRRDLPRWAARERLCLHNIQLYACAHRQDAMDQPDI